MNRIVRQLFSNPDLDLAILTVVVAAGLYGVTALHTAEASNVDLFDRAKSTAPALTGSVKKAAEAVRTGAEAGLSYEIKEEFDYTTSRPTLVVVEVQSSIGSTP